MTVRAAVYLAVGACAAPAGGTGSASFVAGGPARTLSVEAALAELRPPDRNAPFADTTAAEHDYLRAAFDALWRGRVPAGSAGFVVERWVVDGQRFVVLRERPGTARGAGIYVFRTGGRGDVVLQAPHGGFDRYTLSLAARLFFSPVAAGRARALYVNSVDRRQTATGERGGDPHGPADLARASEHAFTTLTELAARAGAAAVVQIHGFGATPAGVDAIVSAGDDTALAPRAARTAAALAAATGARIARYPDDVRVLGGTRNAQGRALRGTATAFVHVELSLPLRRTLAADAAMRSAFGRALLAPGDR